METQFPLFLEAAHAVDQSKWAIGDALLIECGPPGTKAGYVALREASKYLQSEGCDGCDVSKLSALRNVAFAFSSSQRRNVGWEIHRAAGTPEILDTVISCAAHEKIAVTVRYTKETRASLEYLQKHEAEEVVE